MTSSVLWIIREIALAAMAAEAAECVSSLICTSVVLSSPTLDLSSKCLTELPEELYTARHVEDLFGTVGKIPQWRIQEALEGYSLFQQVTGIAGRYRWR
eukprot:m.123520 g.123520  ORF g.123520 m.123520 type:complete len:99 (+) comp37823_c0_seq12:326-622(+)